MVYKYIVEENTRTRIHRNAFADTADDGSLWIALLCEMHACYMSKQKQEIDTR